MPHHFIHFYKTFISVAFLLIKYIYKKNDLGENKSFYNSLYEIPKFIMSTFVQKQLST